MMTFSSNDGRLSSDRTYSSSATPGSDDFEFNQEGKPLKAAIGLAILVALALVLAFFKPAADNMAKSPSLQEKGSAITQMNRAPGQTTGQAPTSTN